MKNNFDNFVRFAQLVPTRGEQAFISYADLEGNEYKAIASVDQNGQKRPYVVYWSARERILKVPKNKKITVEVNGKSKEMLLVDYIRNYPLVEGSPNQTGAALFKEMDDVRDAKMGIERKEIRIKYSNKALEMNPQELSDMAAMVGEFRHDPDVQKFRVLEFADRDPEGFARIYESPDFQVRALLRKGVASGVVKQEGRLYKWANELWPDEDSAVSVLLKDNKVLKALESHIKKVK